MILTSLTCIALTVYHEARGEPYDGQLAVAEVIVNRIQDAAFPGDACSVMREAADERGISVKQMADIEWGRA